MSHPLDATFSETLDLCETAQRMRRERLSSRGPVALAAAPAAAPVVRRVSTASYGGAQTIESIVKIEYGGGVPLATAKAVAAAMVAMPPVIKDYLAEIGGRIILKPVESFIDNGRNAVGLCSRGPGSDKHNLFTIAGMLPEDEVVRTLAHEVAHAADLSGDPPLSAFPEWLAIWNDAKIYHRVDERFKCDSLASEFFSECFATTMMVRCGRGTRDPDTMTAPAMCFMERLFRAWGAE
jgi:hypothetical protein